MHNLPVSATHRRQAVAICQILGEMRIDDRLVLPLVGHHAILDKAVGFNDQINCLLTLRIVERIGDLKEFIQILLQDPVLLAKIPCHFPWRGPSCGTPWGS